MDHVEIDAHLAHVKAVMERNQAAGYPISFQDAVVIHLWDRIQDLEAEVSILMTAHMNSDAGGSEP